MTDSAVVRDQYSDDEKLAIRQRLHIKYSTARGSLFDWLFEQYRFAAPCRVLELGCGNANQWQGRLQALPQGSLLVLSDLSRGMVELVGQKYCADQQVLAQVVDIQHIPFADNSFDVVIANHMLYHVPELQAALAQVRRVLRPGGCFYAATNGSGGMPRWLNDALQRYDPTLPRFDVTDTFTLQNGAAHLQPFFDRVQSRLQEDALQVTQTQDLVDWIASTSTMTGIAPQQTAGMYAFFEQIRLRENGAIHIPKEVGLFIAQNPKKEGL